MKFLVPESVQQIAGQLDSMTCVKIIKGFVHAFCVGALTGGVESAFGYVQHIDVGNPALTMMLLTIVGAGYNAWREIKRGIPQSQAVDPALLGQ
jgi:hypothetical protein